MNASQQLANRFREVLLNGTWIANTNFKQQLSDVAWEQATTKVKNVNSIALLTFHINYYIDGILPVFRGSLDIRDQYSFDCPPLTSKVDWDQLRQALLTNAETFAKCVEVLSDKQLQDPFVDEKYGTYQRNIEGMIEHSYYHLGQISLIKKMILQHN